MPMLTNLNGTLVNTVKFSLKILQNLKAFRGHPTGLTIGDS